MADEISKESIPDNEALVYMEPVQLPEQPMKWIAIAPLYCRAVEDLPAKRFEFSPELAIDVTPDWAKKDEAMMRFAEDDRERLEKSVLSLTSEYEAESVGEVQSRILGVIITGNVSLWLAKPSSIFFRCAFHFRVDGSSFIFRDSHISTQHVFANPGYENEKLNTDDLEMAKRIFLALQNAERSLLAARWFLWGALTSYSIPIRCPLLWTVLEALFGFIKPTYKITHRLCQRIAFFLAGDNSAKAQELYESAKDGYNLRSRYVHGNQPSEKDKPTMEKFLFAEMLVRDSIVKIVNDPGLVEIFSGDKREKFLDDLIFDS